MRNDTAPRRIKCTTEQLIAIFEILTEMKRSETQLLLRIGRVVCDREHVLLQLLTHTTLSDLMLCYIQQMWWALLGDYYAMLFCRTLDIMRWWTSSLVELVVDVDSQAVSLILHLSAARSSRVFSSSAQRHVKQCARSVLLSCVVCICVSVYMRECHAHASSPDFSLLSFFLMPSLRCARRFQVFFFFNFQPEFSLRIYLDIFDFDVIITRLLFAASFSLWSRKNLFCSGLELLREDVRKI